MYSHLLGRTKRELLLGGAFPIRASHKEYIFPTKGADSDWNLALIPNNNTQERITNLMGLQDRIELFQQILVFSHFKHSASDKCRMASLMSLVKESPREIYIFLLAVPMFTVPE